MNREQEKAQYELDVFLKFIGLAGLEIDRESIRPGDHTRGEPDILCKTLKGDSLAFELGRLTSSDLREVQNSRNPEKYGYMRPSDDTEDISRKKMKKTYQVNCPVDLLLYTEFFAFPEVFVFQRAGAFAKTLNHAYRKVWFLGKHNDVHILHQRS